MGPSTKLTAIKVLHTAIWIFFNIVIFYLLYAVFADRIDRWFWTGLGARGEVLAPLLFRWSCPLTVGPAGIRIRQANFDIYLPSGYA
ncbi:MAG: hypothetical protein IPI95_08765 [Flavobacteriales bacterium]|nr:hypothetical protein [Flavobacteriales bacterium]